MQHGQLLIGDGFDRSTLQPMSPDDIARQESRNVIPRFFTSVISTKDGFIEKEYVEILVPGDAKSVPVRAMDDNLRARFAPQYQAWKAGQEDKLQGTPVELMVGTGTLLHELRAKHIHTVEALANITDGQLDAIGMGARQLREKAKTFLDSKARMDAILASDKKDQVIVDLQARLALLEGKAVSPASGGDGSAEAAPVDPERPPEGAVRVMAAEPRRSGPGKARQNS